KAIGWRSNLSKLRQSLQPAPASVSSMMARFLDSSLHKRLALFLLATFAFLCVANRYVGVTYDEPVYIEEASGTAAMYQAAFDQLKHLNLVGAFRTVKDSPNWDKNPMDIGFQRIYNGFVLFLFGKWAGAIWLQRGAVALAWVGLLLVLFLLGREAFGPTAGWAAMIIALGTP